MRRTLRAPSRARYWPKDDSAKDEDAVMLRRRELLAERAARPGNSLDLRPRPDATFLFSTGVFPGSGSRCATHSPRCKHRHRPAMQSEECLDANPDARQRDCGSPRHPCTGDEIGKRGQEKGVMVQILTQEKGVMEKGVMVQRLTAGRPRFEGAILFPARRRRGRASIPAPSPSASSSITT